MSIKKNYKKNIPKYFHYAIHKKNGMFIWNIHKLIVLNNIKKKTSAYNYS